MHYDNNYYDGSLCCVAVWALPCIVLSHQINVVQRAVVELPVGHKRRVALQIRFVCKGGRSVNMAASYVADDAPLTEES